MIELHPAFQQAALSARSRALGIAAEAYSPLGQGADLDAADVTALAEEQGQPQRRLCSAGTLVSTTS